MRGKTKESRMKQRFRFGWSRKMAYGKTPTLFIGKLPGRKSYCLYTQDGSVVEPRAYFRTEKDAAEVYDLLELLIGAGG